jgi:hypothetical protein
MPPLAAIERFFERLFEHPSARFFRTRVQPVQLQRRIERAMEAERLSTADRTLVPNRYVVRLHPIDHRSFGEFATTLAAELADGALLFARAHRYTLVDRPRVDIVPDPSVVRSDIRVDARFADPIGGRTASPDALGESGSTPVPSPATNGAPSDPSPTMVFNAPRPSGPRARLREIRPDGRERVIAVEGRLLSVGRGADNGLILADARASRHHAQIVSRRGTLVFTDVGSTNGSTVNGHPVDEVVLGEGDRIRIGDTILVVETVDPAG